MSENSVTIIHVQMMPDGRLDLKNAALYLGLRPQTLKIWRCEGKGPRAVKLGGRLFYFKADLDQFISNGRDAA